jgi:4-amino-4-deoxy-L-arabinose transferase-like glycosyltransferase
VLSLIQEDLKYRNRALLLVVLVTVYHLMIIGTIGPGDNEAYYWTWSQHLDWSYYDHPPAVAWMIALTTAVGGDSPFFLRVGTAFLFVVSCLFIYLLAVEMTGSRKTAFFSLLVANLIPLYFLVGILTVPDAPLTAFWLFYLFLLYRVRRGVLWTHWLLMGAVLGLALLSKYFAVLLVPSTFLFLASDPQLKRFLKTPFPYLTVAFSAVVASPILFWNIREDWSSFVFHLKTRHEQGFSLGNTLDLFVGQIGVVTPLLLFLLFVTLCVLFKRGFKADGRVQERFIVMTSAPTLLFFYVVMCLTEEAEPHWPGLGYLPLLIGVAWLYAEIQKKKAPLWEKDERGRGRHLPLLKKMIRSPSALKALIGVSLGFPFLLLLAVNIQLFYPIYRPAFSAIALENSKTGWEVSQYDPTNDLFGWDEVAERVGEIMREMEIEGSTPFVFCSHYNPASQLSFALKDPHNVYCLSEATDQFDFWQDIGKLDGKDAIFVMTSRYYLPPFQEYIFDSIEGPETIETYRAGNYKVRETYIYRCYNFKGEE